MLFIKPEFIRNVNPGDSITENGYKCLGISNNKATVMGELHLIKEGDYKIYYVKSKTNCYTPIVHDIVIGKVYYSSSEYYKLDLGRHSGILPALNFPNATKRNKLELKKGDLVLCQVINCNSTNGDVLLSCTSIAMGKIDKVYELECWKVRFLYFSDYIKKLCLNFKVALAMNGYIYVETEDLEKEKEVVKYLQNYTGIEESLNK